MTYLSAPLISKDALNFGHEMREWSQSNLASSRVEVLNDSDIDMLAFSGVFEELSMELDDFFGRCEDVYLTEISAIETALKFVKDPRFEIEDHLRERMSRIIRLALKDDSPLLFFL